MIKCRVDEKKVYITAGGDLVVLERGLNGMTSVG